MAKMFSSNRLAAGEYSYTVVYHVRDLIKVALAEAVDQEVVERNVARKTVIPEIEESDKPVLPWRCMPSCWPVLTASVTAPSS